jgi:hypothetical protein
LLNNQQNSKASLLKLSEYSGFKPGNPTPSILVGGFDCGKLANPLQWRAFRLAEFCVFKTQK